MGNFAPADAISRLLDHIGLRAHTFYAGPLCGLHDFDAKEGVGHLHVVRAGAFHAEQPGRPTIMVTEPALLFYPRPHDHRLEVPDYVTAEVLCASVRYDAGMDNALSQSLPAVVIIPFQAMSGLESILSVLFAEAGSDALGRQVLLDRLCDVILIQIVRHAIGAGLVAHGVLAGLAHPRLGKPLVEMLDAPARNWTLEALAAQGYLSRNTFAVLFREVVGVPPAAFLTQVRIGFAQRLLRKGQALAAVAQAVGYGSQPAFSRAFIRETGMAPSEWLRQKQT